MGRAYVAITITTILWAINFTVGKIGTAQIDPLFIASSRIVITGLVFYAMLPRADRKITRADLKAILPLSATGIVINHVCFAVGISRTTPSHSAVIHSLVPVFVAVAAFLILGERLSARGIVGMLIALSGTLLVVLRSRPQEFQGTAVGDAVSAVGITAFSLYIVLGRRVLQTMESMRAVTLAFLFATPAMLPLLVWGTIRQDWSKAHWDGWLAMAYMLIFANMICYRLHTYALARLRAGQAAAFTNLQPGIAIGVAVLAGMDHLSAPLVAGTGIALVGVILVQTVK